MRRKSPLQVERIPVSLYRERSLSSVGDDPERRAIAAEYVDSLLESTGWTPDRIALFEGCAPVLQVRLSQAPPDETDPRGSTGDVDTSREYEYTDWDDVEAFANDFDGFVERRLDTE